MTNKNPIDTAIERDVIAQGAMVYNPHSHKVVDTKYIRDDLVTEKDATIMALAEALRDFEKLISFYETSFSDVCPNSLKRKIRCTLTSHADQIQKARGRRGE